MRQDADALDDSGPDLLGLYLREIGRVPRLSRDEERELGGKATAGDREAQHRMVEANLRLVVAIATREWRRFRRMFPLLDLIQAGNLGLLDAAGHWHPDGKAPFGSYAAVCIRRAIVNATCCDRLVHVPEHVIRRLIRVRRIARRLEQELKRSPSQDEIASAAGVSVQWLTDAEQAREVVSLDAQQPGDDGDELPPLHASLADEHTPAADVALAEWPTVARLVDNLLSPRERQVVVDRFGLNGAAPLTLKATAGRLKLSAQMVLLIERQALAKLSARIEDPSCTVPTDRMQKRLSDARIIELLVEGKLSQADVARCLGIHYSTVWKRMRRANAVTLNRHTATWERRAS